MHGVADDQAGTDGVEHRARTPPRSADPVLVVGAGGFLGRAIAAALVEAGVPVIGLGPEPPAGIPFRRFHAGRREDPALLAAALAGVTRVVDAAGTLRPGSPVASPSAALEQEVRPAVELAERAAASDVRRLIFLSSGGAVYGPAGREPIPETHPAHPTGTYGLAKLRAEHDLAALGDRTGMVVTRLRIANAYGPGQRVRDGQGFVAALVDAARRGAPLGIWGDGSVVRDFIAATDVAHAVRAALAAAAPPEVVNIGSGAGVSLLGLVRTFEAAIGRPVDLELLPSRPVDLPWNVLAIETARRTLGWQPRIALADGLRATWAAATGDAA